MPSDDLVTQADLEELTGQLVARFGGRQSRVQFGSVAAVTVEEGHPVYASVHLDNPEGTPVQADPVTLPSLIGAPALGSRVAVLVDPPHQMYVMSVVTGGSVGMIRLSDCMGAGTFTLTAIEPFEGFGFPALCSTEEYVLDVDAHLTDVDVQFTLNPDDPNVVTDFRFLVEVQQNGSVIWTDVAEASTGLSDPFHFDVDLVFSAGDLVQFRYVPEVQITDVLFHVGGPAVTLTVDSAASGSMQVDVTNLGALGYTEVFTHTTGANIDYLTGLGADSVIPAPVTFLFSVPFEGSSLYVTITEILLDVVTTFNTTTWVSDGVNTTLLMGTGGTIEFQSGDRGPFHVLGDFPQSTDQPLTDIYVVNPLIDHVAFQATFDQSHTDDTVPWQSGV